jgi:hypothetical protein
LQYRLLPEQLLGGGEAGSHLDEPGGEDTIVGPRHWKSGRAREGEHLALVEARRVDGLGERHRRAAADPHDGSVAGKAVAVLDELVDGGAKAQQIPEQFELRRGVG